MRNINLIPKVPYVQKNFLPLAISVAAVFVFMSSAIVAYSYEIGFDKAENEKTMTQLQAQIQFLAKQKEEDPLAKEYNAFFNQVSSLKASRRYWIPVFDLLFANLPKASRLVSADVAQAAPNGGQGAENAEQINVNYEFADMTQTADYIVLLQKSPLVGKITITAVNRVENRPAEKTAQQAPSSPAAASSVLGSGFNAADPGKAAGPISKENFLKSLEQQMPASQTKGDELLNQLRWQVTQQMVEQQFNIKVPDKSFVSPAAPELPPQSPISPDEYNKAKAQYEAFKQQQVGEQRSGGSSEPKRPETPPVISYQVSLQITLKPPAKEK